MGEDRRDEEDIRSTRDLERKTLGDDYRTIIEEKHLQKNGKGKENK